MIVLLKVFQLKIVLLIITGCKMEPAKFTINPQNGDRVIDKYGVLWIYDARVKSWIDKGYVDVYGVVSEDSDGLVYPSLFEVVDSIDPNKFNGLKILDNAKASFYYVYSSDKTIKLKSEEHLGEHRLRVEVDQSVLARKFREFRCQGPRGERGDKGEQGITGIPAANEPIHKLIDENGLVEIEVEVATPIDTPVSLRLLRNQQQIGEFLVYQDGEVAMAFLDEYSLKEGTTYDVYVNNNILYATFELEGDLSGTWTYKARQTGPKGDGGDDGNWFLAIEETEISDDNLVSNDAIYEISKSGNDIGYSISTVNDNVCATGVIPADPGFFKLRLATTKFLAAKYMVPNCRDLVRWEYEKPIIVVPELDVPQWTPTECCPKTRVS